MFYMMLVMVLLVLLATGFLGGFVSRCGTFTHLVSDAFIKSFFPQID